MAVFRRTLTPNPRSTPRPALATRALQGTRAHGAHAVPARPNGRGAPDNFLTIAFKLLEVTVMKCRGGSVAGDWRRAAQGCAAAASQTGCLPSRGADPRPRCRPLTEASVLLRRTLTPTPLPEGEGRPTLRRGRSAARAPMARKLCLLAPRESGLSICHELSVANCQYQRTLDCD